MDENIFNTNAETAILSIILKFPATYFSVTTIREEMFSSTPNKIIWNTIHNLAERSLIPDKDMVINELKIKNKIIEAGTESYINYLSSQTFTETNLQEHIEQLISAYKAVGILSLTSGLADRLLHTSNVDEEITSIRQKLDKLQDITSTGISESIADFADEVKTTIEERTNNPGKVGFEFGIKDVDTFTGGVEPGMVWVIGGRASIGKTLVAVNSILNSAKAGNPVLLFSLESSRQKIVERLIAIDIDMPLQDIHLGTLDGKQMKKIKESIETLRKLPIYIDTKFTPSMEYLVSTIRKMVKQKGIKVVYVDYLQLLSGRGDDIRLEIGRMSRGLKLLAGQLDIGVVLLSQVSRECERRDDKRPTLPDLAESGDIERDADLVAFIYRDLYYNKDTKSPNNLEFIIRKYRDGATGTIMCTVDLETNKIGSK